MNRWNPGLPLPSAEYCASVTPSAGAVSGPRATSVSSALLPSTTTSGVSDAAILKCRVTVGAWAARAVIDSITAVRPTVYSRLTPLDSSRIALEPAHALGDRTAPHFRDGRRRLARIGESRPLSELPARIDAVGDPHGAKGLGRGGLATGRLLVRPQVRPWRQCVRGKRLPVPDRGHPQQIGIERGPAPVTEIEHQRARAEIVGMSQACRPGIDDGREEGEVRLDPIGQSSGRRFSLL